MGSRRSRRSVGVLIIAAAASILALAPASGVAGSLDACAQRVIRDWYSGGRVDGAYPLGCYRAAIRALPDDVLQYSNADQDIRRALAFARRGRDDPGNAAPAKSPAQESDASAEARSVPAPSSSASPPPSPVAREAASQPREAPLVAEGSVSPTSVPYPILVLAALAAVLLAAGAAGWLASRRG